METRNVKITLQKAREWYNSDNESLREVVLQAFSEKELTAEPYESITSFVEACEALGITQDAAGECIRKLSDMGNMSRMLVAQYKLAIIKKALNGDWKPEMNDGRVYYSWLRWYPAGSDYDIDTRTKQVVFKDLCNGKNYVVVGGGDFYDCDGGLGNFGCGYGGSVAYLGLLGCKSPEIVKHLTKHFGQIVFDAIYGSYNNYKWV